MKLQIPATIQSFRTMADSGIRLTVDTQELSPEASQALLTLVKKFGWLLFSENLMKEEDVPEDKAPEFKSDKSPSKRLKDCLFVYWKNNTKQTKDFETFWREWIDKKCNEIKDLLP